MINNMTLIGRLTRDPIVQKKIEKDKSVSTVTTFTIATDRLFKVDGKKVTDFITCIATGDRAAEIARELKKGYMVHISGHVYTRRIEQPNGTNIKDVYVRVRRYSLISVPGGTLPQKGQSNKSNTGEDTIDDLPI